MVMAAEPKRPYAAYGAKIRAARKARGLNQTALAQVLGVGQTTLSEWETGASAPPLPLAVQLARTLGVGIADLVASDDEEPHP